MSASRETLEQYPFADRVRTPGGRIAAATAWVAAGGLLVAGLAAGSLPLIAAGAVGWILAMAAVNVAGGGVGVMRTEELDEREVRERESAYAGAHRAMTGLLFGAWIWAIAADSDLMPYAAAAALLQMATPSLLLAARGR